MSSTPRPLLLVILLALPRSLNAADMPPATRTPRLDAYGDPLPTGAVARLGTIRFRHGNFVNGITWSADSKALLISATDMNLISFWDIATNKELRRINPNNSPCGLALSADGKRLATAGPLRLLDTTSGKQLFECAKEHQAVSLAFSPDGKLLAATGLHTDAKRSSWEVVLHDAATGKEMHRLAAEGLAFAFAPDGKTLAHGTTGGCIALVDLETGKQTREWKAHNYRVGGLAFAPDGKTLASGGGFDHTICLWDVQTAKELRRLSGHKSEICHIAFTPDGKTLVSGGWREAARVWDVTTGKELHNFDDTSMLGSTVYALSPDGTKLVAGNYLQLWDVTTGKEIDPRPVVFGPLAFSPDGKTVVSADRTVQVWDAATGKRRHDLGGRTSGSPPAFSPDGKRFVVVLGDQTARAWDPATGKELYQFAHERAGGTVAFFPDGKTLLWADEGHAVSVHDAMTGKVLRHVPLARDDFGRVGSRLVFAPDGKRIAAVLEGDRKFGRDEDGGVRLWDAATGKVVRTLAGERAGCGPYRQPAFSPDGKLLAIAERSCLCLWDVGAAKELRRWPAHSINGLMFSSDGSVLASVGEDKVVRLWEVATGAAVHELTGYRGWISHVAFSPDGRLLATSGFEGFALVWDLSGQAAGLIEPAAKDLPRLWDDLKGDDARRAYQAACRLAASAEGVTFLAKQLKTDAPSVDGKQLAKLVANLDADDFDSREMASRELVKLGRAAEPALREALRGRPSAELRRRVESLLAKLEEGTWNSEAIRARRAVAALERAGNPEAWRALGELEKVTGEAGDFARAALRRRAAGSNED